MVASELVQGFRIVDIRPTDSSTHCPELLCGRERVGKIPYVTKKGVYFKETGKHGLGSACVSKYCCPVCHSLYL